ncbi:hypothetical protein M407DRAFT_101634 [Tulasnella calospora MUT 4182]|uniref:Uncharacterized protein n=1 Tax=Tulasnella calospora MUT 4182 TaxID=1051891 RepID=A0A0C3Q5F5_9AGAM|nr:hypothetical protein M407DRAFT_101634 [Tulasnella calospora MUT 4182]
MQVLNPPVPRYDYLGMTHFSDSPKYSLFGPDSTASASLTCTTKPNAKRHVTSMRRNAGEPVSGKSRAAIWNFLADSTIIPIVEESGCQYALIPFVLDDSKMIVLVANCESYMARASSTPRTGSRVKLVFEPV